MAKFSREEVKGFSPIDSKLLSGLAEAPAADPAPPEPPAPVEVPPVAAASPVEMPRSSVPKRAKPDIRSEPIPTPATRPQPPQEERLDRVVKCLFTASEEQELRNMVNRLRERAGFSLTFSHLVRPFVKLLLQGEDQLGDELAHAGLRRPINDKHALDAFEREMALLIHQALRKTESASSNKRA